MPIPKKSEELLDKYCRGQKKCRRSKGSISRNGSGYKAEYSVWGVKALVNTFATEAAAQNYLAERISLRDMFYDMLEAGELNYASAKEYFDKLINGDSPFEVIVSGDMPFAAYCKIYTDDCLKNRCEITSKNACRAFVNYDRVQDCKGFIGKHIETHPIGKTAINKLSGTNFIKFTKDLLEDLAPKTVKNILQFCSQVIEGAKEVFDKDNRMQCVKFPKKYINDLVRGGMRVKEPEVYTEEECKKLIESGYCISESKGLLLEFILRSGVRRGEALGLRFSDIDFELKRVHIQRAIERHNNPDYKEGSDAPKTIVVYNSPLKTISSYRWVSIPEELSAKLRQYRDERIGNGDKEDSYCFVNAAGKVFDPDYVRVILKKAANIAGVKCIKVHELRNTYATLEYNRTHDIKAVQAQLGHASVSMTRRYIVKSSD